jgi:hypothetical protein
MDGLKFGCTFDLRVAARSSVADLLLPAPVEIRNVDASTVAKR